MRVLVLSPHTDDGELGCGATISRFLREGYDVRYVAFSAAEEACEESGFPLDTCRKECDKALDLLEVPAEKRLILDFRVRKFPEYRQDILQQMIALRDRIQPSIVFLPAQSDTHQDHYTVSAEGFRAFKKTTMFGYELPCNNLTFTASAFVRVSSEDVQRKVKAVLQYKSQADRDYMSADVISATMRLRGSQIGVTFAESFETIRWVQK